MPNYKFTEFDCKSITKDLKNIIGYYVSKIQRVATNTLHVTSQTYRLTLNLKGVKKILIINVGSNIYLSQNEYKPIVADVFCKKIKTLLDNGRILNIEHNEGTKLFAIVFKQVKIIFDFYGKGDFVVIDTDTSIIKASWYQSSNDKKIDSVIYEKNVDIVPCKMKENRWNLEKVHGHYEIKQNDDGTYNSLSHILNDFYKGFTLPESKIINKREKKKTDPLVARRKHVKAREAEYHKLIEDAEMQLQLAGYTSEAYIKYNSMFKNNQKKKKKAHAARIGLNQAEAKQNVESKISIPEKRSYISLDISKTDEFRKAWTSSGRIILGGRTAAGNIKLIRTRLEKGDLYFHADVHGASSVILKDGVNAKPNELEQAADCAASWSSAWSDRWRVKVWQVNYNQVSLAAPSGQNMPTGSVMAYGKRIWFAARIPERYIGIYPGVRSNVIVGPRSVINSNIWDIDPKRNKNRLKGLMVQLQKLYTKDTALQIFNSVQKEI